MTFPKTRNWRFNARYGALALLAMSLSACSLEERKTARVVIDLSELRSDRGAASRWDASSVNATAMSTPAELTWGNGGRTMNTPLSNYNQLDCVMLNVMGEGIPSAWPDKPGYRPRNLDLSNACSYTYPGTYSIPTTLNQTTIELSVSVQKGPSRLVQLIGFKKPAALRCEDITLPMMRSKAIVSLLHELGKTKVDLMSDATVEIQGSLTTAQTLECDGGASSVAFNSYGFTIPVPSCDYQYANVYLYQKSNGSPLNRTARKMSSGVLSCYTQTLQGPDGDFTESFIKVPGATSFPYNGALDAISGNPSEPAVTENDQLALEVRWADTGGIEVSGSTRLMREARYDSTAPSTINTNSSLAYDPPTDTFTANFPNLSEDGFASIRQGVCTYSIAQVTAEKSVAGSSGPFAVSFSVDPLNTLTPGPYSVWVHDFAWNWFCAATIQVQ